MIIRVTTGIYLGVLWGMISPETASYAPEITFKWVFPFRTSGAYSIGGRYIPLASDSPTQIPDDAAGLFNRLLHDFGSGLLFLR